MSEMPASDLVIWKPRLIAQESLMMKRIVAAGVPVAVVSVIALAAPPESGSTRPKNAGLERIKSLAGEWVELNDKGEPGKDVSVAYRVTAAGSAVVETLFPGQEHEMVSVYFCDGDDLTMTHYCCLGNQPRLKVDRQQSDANRIVFACAGGTNIKSENDHHMHGLTLTFIDKDHVKAECVGMENGKKACGHVADLVRRNPQAEARVQREND